ncbi:DNA repair ATPase [Hahella sp. CR1]|uniref:DNA repair ATPase n=1 Tax=unclassified Hahella TaxID=2624107 RepID=UPI0024426262|nr:DNA repair ATPase [Hahella sp. CR1]MDG9667517.1 DNA repair ATPase [Hahella sp. CR1]
MPKPQKDDIYEAVLFLEDQYVARQMRYSEFEAILDGVVALNDLADTEITAVYAELNKQLVPRALVFFTVYFDEEGIADSEWNVPLKRLAKISGSGPDLGAGPIRLACRSQCAISWHQRDLWDPDMKPGGNDFQVIKKSLQENRLGFEVVGEVVEEEEDIPVLTPTQAAPQPAASASALEEQERIHRTKLARLLKAQRLRIKTLNSQHEAEIEELNRQHRLEMQALKTKVQDMEQSLQHTKVLYDQTKIKLQKRSDQYLSLQEEMVQFKKRQSMLEKELSKGDGGEEAERLRQRLESELTIVKEQLQRREAELVYRDEREEQLRQEIQTLKDESEDGGGDILNKLSELDVVFVVYHPGAGHITIPAKDVLRYIQNPVSYAAERCFVTERHYKEWLDHYENAVCEHEIPGKGLCGESVPRVTVPAEFVAGESNRCEKHQE